jgi:hypothetical protein
MANRSGSRRNPLRATSAASLTLHPTKGFRRISPARVKAQGRMAAVQLAWSKIGAAVL